VFTGSEISWQSDNHNAVIIMMASSAMVYARIHNIQMYLYDDNTHTHAWQKR